MKELSIEEKAKAYDEALKVLHKYDGANIMFSQSLKEEMFPELKESEDERIKKSLLYVIEHHPTLPTEEAEEYIAWLEKQGEQKPVEWSDEYKGLLEAQYQQGYEDGKKVHVNVEWSEEDRNKVADYLYCLNVGFTQTAAKQRAKDICDLLCPQKQWKPSEELLDNLSRAWNGATFQTSLLRELYEQLKALQIMGDDTIRDLYKQGYLVDEIAEMLGLVKSTVLKALQL